MCIRKIHALEQVEQLMYLNMHLNNTYLNMYLNNTYIND